MFLLLLLIIVIWLVVGFSCGVLGHLWDMKKCPTRGDAIIMSLFGPACAFYLFGVILDKLKHNPWFDEPLC